MKIIRLSLLLLIFLSTNFPGNGNPVALVSGQCQKDQQSLLLQMKNSLVFNSTLSVRLVQWNQSTDCCTWSGVDCDMAGHVIGLDLGDESISGGIDNSSDLFSLKHLQRLNLALNGFGHAQIPSGLANLTNLTYLNLSSAGFSGQIPIEISGMTRLITLDLSCDKLVSQPHQFVLISSSYCDGSQLEIPNLKALVRNLSELRELYLDGVTISANGTEWCQALSSSVPNLQVLSFIYCDLSGPIHSSLVDLRSLSVISLDGNNLSSPIPDFFADFPNLKFLSLSDCHLFGKLPEYIFKVSTLETLRLDNNPLLHGSLPDFSSNNSFQNLIFHSTNLSGTLPHSISNLKCLSTLVLSNCNFTGLLPTSMANLTQLVELHLPDNHFTGPIPYSCIPKSLKYLDLSSNVLIDGISSISWDQFPNLVYIDLSNNFFNGTIHPALFELPMLQQLRLANNQLEGQIHDISNASSSALELLVLRGNRLEGPIPKSIFELKKLEELSLSFNKFNGTVQLDIIGRLGDLTYFDLSHNNLAVNVSSSFSSFPPKVNMLYLASCNLSVIPNLRNRVLYGLDLSDNQISGNIPNWIWQVVQHSLNLSHNNLVGLQKPHLFSNLVVIDLHSNQLEGEIPLPVQGAGYVDYSSNNFNSSIPDSAGYVFNSFCEFFSVSNNMLTGVIPKSMCNISDLQILDLSSNNLSGRIPACLVDKGVKFGVLNLRNNSLFGTIPDRFPLNCGFQTLILNGNQLQGMVPRSLANCKMLEILDFGNNNISDTFPCWLKNVSSLHVLTLQSNKFHGDISCIEYNVSWPVLQIFDLAFNNFIGRLPRKGLTSWAAMMVDESKAERKDVPQLHYDVGGFIQGKDFYQDAITVTMKGQQRELVKILPIFTSIDLSSNNFQGSIPEELGSFKSLHLLNLSHNALSGLIPSSVGNLQQLESLDLSMNNLQGHIPRQLANLNFLSILNLSYNHLVGRIPRSTQLQSFSHTSFEGNEGLCGPPLRKNCSNTTQIPTPNSRLDPSGKEFDWQFYLVTGVGFGTGFVASVAPLIFSDRVDLWYDILVNKFLGRFCI